MIITVADLPHLLASTFDVSATSASRARMAMEYAYTPERAIVHDGGLAFDLILNEARRRYVTETLTRISPRARSSSADVRRYLAEHTRHMAPPGATVCPFDDADDSDLFLGTLDLCRSYSVVVNRQPWGYHHFMLISTEPRGQYVTAQDLTACMVVLRTLGGEYEATFSGVLAGASVLHFHFQVHKGAAAIWKNIREGAIERRRYLDGDVSASYLEGWPAHTFLIEGASDQRVAEEVCRLLETLRRRTSPIPYNLGLRLTPSVAVCVVPRTATSERPTRLNDEPGSWGRFSFNEMGGSIVLLSRSGFEATRRAPGGIHAALEEMSITAAERDEIMLEQSN